MIQRNSLVLNKLIALLVLAFSVSGCNDNYISSIPNFPVYLELNLITTYPIFRNSFNKTLIFTKPITAIDRVGYGGVLVCTGFDGQYYAFDMSCPYEHSTNTRVYPNGLGQVVCEGCGSVFNIGYGIGDPASGKAKEILKRYRASISGDVLYVLAN